MRCVLRPVEVGGHGASKVAHANVDGHAGGALVGAREIVGEPGDVAGEGGVNGAGGDEDASVGYAWVFGGYAPVTWMLACLFEEGDVAMTRT
jgi:hypothetical protein